jgi:DNA-binding NarL/FixJ family response regulator
MAENLKKAKDMVFSRASAARNREIISMYMDGIGYNVIAEKLGRSTHTPYTHVHRA